MFVEQSTYLELVRVLRAQPAHRRPSFLDASRKVGIDRRTIATAWERGWPASKDPRRPTDLPPLKDVCAVGTDAPDGLYPVAARVAAPAVPVIAPKPPLVGEEPVSTEGPTEPARPGVSTVAGPSSEPRATAPGPESGPIPTPAPSPGDAPAPSPAAAPAPATPPAPAAIAVRDPVAEIAARQAALEALEAKNIAGSLAVASHISSTGDAVLKLLFDSVMTPAAQERLRSFVVEKPERFMSLLAELSKAVEASSKASERFFSMRRLAEGKSTSIQEHRTEPKPHESPARTAAHIVAVMDELAALGRAQGRPLGLEAIDVEATEVSSEEEG
jgi:hypothetical protein